MRVDLAQRDVEAVVLAVRARVMRILERRGLLELGSDDTLAHQSPALSAC